MEADTGINKKKKQIILLQDYESITRTTKYKEFNGVMKAYLFENEIVVLKI